MVDYIRGDVNGDGIVDDQDVALISDYVAGLIGEDDLILEAADINGDGIINTKDVRILSVMTEKGLKVVNGTQLDADLTTVADAIRAKGGTSDMLSLPDGMVDAITRIETGPSYNIAYGDTAPEDTTKLWVKCAQPNVVQITATQVINEELEESISALPVAAYGIASAAIGTKIYLFGGYDGDSYMNTIQVFDTETNTITTLSTTLPRVAVRIAAAAVGTKIYLFGGYGNKSYLDTVQVFNTETATITALSTTIPTPADSISAATVGANIYLFGGQSGDNAYLSTINVFDTEVDSITTLSAELPRASHAVATATVGPNIYLFGGYDGTYLSTIHKFIAQVPLTESNLLIEVNGTKNLFELLDGVELYLAKVYLGNAEGIAKKVSAAVYKDNQWTEV